MRWAVLVRAANVGGRVFRPSELVAKLTALRLVSLGAAGTFAAGAGATAAAVRATIAAALPFPAEIMVVPAERWHAYVGAHAVDPAPVGAGARRYVALAASEVVTPPRLPLHFPNETEWGVTITNIDGPFLTGWYRRVGPRVLYPNAVIEKRFKVAATTRWWETVVALDQALQRLPASTAAGPNRRTPLRRATTPASPAARGRAGPRAG